MNILEMLALLIAIPVAIIGCLVVTFVFILVCGLCVGIANGALDWTCEVQTPRQERGNESADDDDEP